MGDFADGYALRALLESGENKDPILPEWWIDVPEPEDNEMLLLIEIPNSPETYSAGDFGYMHDGTNYYPGTFTIDYGNDIVVTVEEGNSSPTGIMFPYTETGQYIISMKSEDRLFYRPVDSKMNSMLMVKCGKNISCVNSSFSPSYLMKGQRLQYMQLGGEPLIGQGYFSSLPSIKKIKYLNSPQEIPARAFTNCYTLLNIEGLEETNIVRSYAFANCYSLSEVPVFAKNCVFEPNAFANCYALDYPRPDGSVI